jgi:Tfp pilus assembly protein PilZ
MSQTKTKLALLIAHSEPERKKLSTVLSQSGEYQVVHTLTAVLDPRLFEEQSFTTVIFDCDILNDKQMTTLRNLSEKIGSAQILILARHIPILAFRQVGTMQNMVALQKPFDEKIFLTVLKGMASADPAASLQRMPRFITDQPVRLVVLGTGLLIPTRMRNYSAGGAFIEYNGISLKVGDRLQVNFVGEAAPLRPAETIQLKAKVVWIKDGDGTRGSVRGVGVQFLNI